MSIPSVPSGTVLDASKSYIIRSIMRRQSTIILSVLLLGIGSGRAIAQHSVGRWTAGLRGGINAFFTDFNKTIIGPGVDATGRYGIARHFSLAGTIGYEELKTHLDPNTLGLPFDYVKLHAFPMSMTGVYHAFPGNTVSPYFSAGVGVLLYQRLDWQANGLPDKTLKTTFAIPLNLGVEYFLNDQLSITGEIGYRILDDKPETVENGGFDSYATLKGGVFYYFGSSDEDDDDSDGLTNGDEQVHGTDRLQPDTDGDGLKDGDEVHLFRSNPRERDTDSDGLDDRVEVMQWKTDPTVSDTDRDGLSDFEETTVGTNPVSADTDGDVLLDGEELAEGSDPLTIDTDLDGLSDYMELRTYRTLVAQVDSDQDSLSDGREVTVTGTNPLTADTDSGGVIDGHEIDRGTDPLDPTDDLLSEQLGIPVGQSIVIEGVVFAPGSSVIGRGSETALENAFITVALLGKTKIDIIGHTDNVGTDAENDRLSLERAEAVLQWFVKQGIDESRLRAVGKGGRVPIAPNTTESGRALNRRIEMLIRN